jgi:signal transduction histidine kinase
MRPTLLWRLLAVTLLVMGVAVTVAALMIRSLAAAIFMNLMKEFHIEVEAMHRLFIAAMGRSLLLASLAAAGVGVLLSLLLFRRVVRPIGGMITMAERIAGGDYTARAEGAGEDEIGRLAEALNRMAAGLATLERLRKDLVANVAHELRTPLANLQGYLEAIGDGVAPASPETIRSLQEEVIRLVRLVEGLHALSLFDARLPRRRAERVDLGGLTRRLVELRRPEFAARGIALSSQIARDGAARGDADLLSQALSNLLDNALKYTPEGGEVRVAVEPAPQAVRVTVANSGEGIASEDLPFIFERFYRGEKSRSRASGGAGIGLSIVKEVARVHGGEVGVDSANGRTTFWLTVPSSPSAGRPA